MKNRRCRNLTHKKYRRYRCDLWGRLSLKRRNNYITTLITDYCVMTLRKRIRRKTPKIKKRIKKFFSPVYQMKTKRAAAFQINIRAKDRRMRPNSQRGILLRMRRQISLYYGGGRIRAKTFRRFGRSLADSSKPIVRSREVGTPMITRYPRTFATIYESRLDVLLMRTNFVDSIYRARHLIFHGKCRVMGIPRVSNPGVQLRNYQKFFLPKKYTALLRKTLIKRFKKGKSFILPPTYLFVDYALMWATLIENPITHLVSFPFSENLGALVNFRKSFRML